MLHCRTMWPHPVLACLLAACVEAFAPAPIRWGGLAAKRYVVAPATSRPYPNMGLASNRAFVPAQRLAIRERPEMASFDIPQFIPKPDNTVALGATGLCIEAGGDKNGDAIFLDQCTGRSNQLWKFVPWGRGRKSQMQLRDTNMCVDVHASDGCFDGAPVELRKCDGKDTFSWYFEEPIQLPTLTPSRGPVPRYSARRVLASCMSMVALGALGLVAWLRWQKKEGKTVVRQEGHPLAVDQGGVSLIEPLAARHEIMPLTPRLDRPAQRKVLATMVLNPEPAKDEDVLNLNDHEKLEKTDPAIGSVDLDVLNEQAARHVVKAVPSKQLSDAVRPAVAYGKVSADVPLKDLQLLRHFLEQYLRSAGIQCRILFKALRRRNVISTLATLSVATVAALVKPMQALASTSELTAGAGLDLRAIALHSLQKAYQGGKAGAAASIIQVFALLWLHTSMIYQHRFGGSLKSAVQAMLKEGGIRRLYRGLSFALVEVPLTRFGVAAANIGTLALFDSIPEWSSVPMAVRSSIATVVGVSWKVVCLPIETAQVALQVDGKPGFERLKKRINKQGPGVLYKGSVVAAIGGVLNILPFLITHNFLNTTLPVPLPEKVLLGLVRSAVVGVGAQCASSVASNSLKVIKTNQQAEGMTAAEAFSYVMEKDGIQGLFGRGLKTRLVEGTIQGAVFNVLWVYFLK